MKKRWIFSNGKISKYYASKLSMNYIGSKLRLSSFLKETITEIIGSNLQEKTFCDLFAGTGIVGRTFKKDVRKVISNDIEYYSFVLNKNYIENYKKVDFQRYIDELNSLLPKEGFIYKHYCFGDDSQRQYFSDENGKKIDAIREKIETYKNSPALYYFLLASLIESADKVANTASVYGAFLKHLKKSAQKPLFLKPAFFDTCGSDHEVYQEDSNLLIKRIEGDILYLDPPYNQRQYGANYHLLNTIAKYDTFEPKGKTGMREYIRSAYCKKNEVAKSFEDLIKSSNFRYTFLSYNNEGLMHKDEVRKIMEKYGKYELVTKAYQRFKADKTENRNHKADKTIESLHILLKE